MIETKLTAAAVYRNGCIAKRSGRVFLQKGNQTVQFTGLSGGIDESTLRLAVPAGISGSNVQVEHPTREQQNEALKELAAKAAALQGKIGRRSPPSGRRTPIFRRRNRCPWGKCPPIWRSFPNAWKR